MNIVKVKKLFKHFHQLNKYALREILENYSPYNGSNANKDFWVKPPIFTTR